MDPDPDAQLNAFLGDEEQDYRDAVALQDDRGTAAGTAVDAASARELEVRRAVRDLEVREEAHRRVAARRVASPPEPVVLCEFLKVPDEPTSYRIEGLLPVGGRALLAAQYKAGKTTLIANLLRALVDGDRFLDREVTAPLGRIALLDAELDERMLRRWLREQDIQQTGRVVVVPLRGRVSSFNLLDPEVRAQWAGALSAHEVDLVILDCLRPVLDSLGLSEDKDTGRVLVAFDEMLAAARIDEGVVVHHMGHSGERSRGDSRLRDWPDVEWRLVRESDDPTSARYFSAYGRDVDVPETELGFNSLTRRLTVVGGNRKEAKARAALPTILALIEEQDGLSGRAIELELVPERLTRAELRDGLKLAIREGHVWTEPGPKKATLHHRRAK